jgi:uncharacterized protein (DUF1015 family)
MIDDFFLFPEEQCLTLDADTNPNDLTITANKRVDKVWKALADSGRVYQAYNEQYLVVTTVIRAKETPEIDEISVLLSDVDEVIVVLDGPRGPAEMAVSTNENFVQIRGC